MLCFCAWEEPARKYQVTTDAPRRGAVAHFFNDIGRSVVNVGFAPKNETTRAVGRCGVGRRRANNGWSGAVGRCAVASTAEPAQPSALLGKQAGVSLQVERPTLISGHAVADALPALAVAVEVAVLDLDPRALRGFGDEPHFPLARFQRVVLDLPLRADVPAQ